MRSVFYKPPEQQSAGRPRARCERHLAAGRRSLQGTRRTRSQRQEFRDKLNGYVRLYAFLSQIIPYGDPDLEMLYSYGRLLALHLPRGLDDGRVTIGDEVGLQYYRLERISAGGSICVRATSIWVKSPTDVGTGACHR